MLSEVIHRLTLPALAITIILTVWVMAWQRATAFTGRPSMPPLVVPSHLVHPGN